MELLARNPRLAHAPSGVETHPERSWAPVSGELPTSLATARAKPSVGHQVIMNSRRLLAHLPSTHQPT
jgi:hypothetical protein